MFISVQKVIKEPASPNSNFGRNLIFILKSVEFGPMIGAQGQECQARHHADIAWFPEELLGAQCIHEKQER
jgi:hypothetical protein